MPEQALATGRPARYLGGVARSSHIRASDADRDAAADRLRIAAGEGRLEPSELEDRIAAALRARTIGELRALVRDLPPDRRRNTIERRRSTGVAVAGAAALALAATAVVALIAVVLIAVAVAWAIAWMAVFATRCAVAHNRRRRRRLAAIT